MINQLLEFCKYLGLIIVIFILFMILVALIQSFIDGIRRRRKKIIFENQLNQEIIKLIKELDKPKKNTKRKTKKDSD